MSLVPAGTLVMAQGFGCDACTHYVFQLEVKTAEGTRTLTRLVPRDETHEATWAYWLVAGDPPQVRIWSIKVGAVNGLFFEGNGEK